MADQSDVETALVTAAAAALYPSGPGRPSIVGSTCRIFRGWPNAAALDADLAAGRVNVSIFPLPHDLRTTTRWLDATAGVTRRVAPTLSISVKDLTATVAGTAAVGQVAGLLVDGAAYPYRVQPSDGLGQVAANLAALVRADRPAALSGLAITTPGSRRLIGRVVADATGLTELRRQLQRFRISCWCPTPASRDIVAAAIDQALAALTFIDLPDGTAGRIRLDHVAVADQSENAALYRRDLVYAIDYATTLKQSLPEMLFGDLLLNATTILA